MEKLCARSFEIFVFGLPARWHVKKSDGLPAGDIYPFHRASIRTTPSMMKRCSFFQNLTSFQTRFIYYSSRCPSSTSTAMLPSGHHSKSLLELSEQTGGGASAKWQS
jgi:hypothetical protein